MEVNDLNGFCEITFTAITKNGDDDQEPPLLHGYCAVLNGLFVSIDPRGRTAAGVIESFDGRDLFYSVVWDASRAHPDVFLLDGEGNQTRDPVTYSGKLSVIEREGTLLATGRADHGPVTVEVRIELKDRITFDE